MRCLIPSKSFVQPVSVEYRDHWLYLVLILEEGFVQLVPYNAGGTV